MFPEDSVVSSLNTTCIKPRPVANYHPSIWKDFFLSLRPEALGVHDEMMKQVEQKKMEVRKMLIAIVDHPFEKLKLVDSIQCLGVSYHFENEIDDVLKKVYMVYSNLLSKDGDEDLNTVSLLFRLLRQQGYRISCVIFTKFTDKNGKFKESLTDDARGILSLYEASHMRIHGEDILEEAHDFTLRHLEKHVANSSPPLAYEVRCALKRPIRKTLQRLKAREYMQIYEQDPLYNATLLTFSKLDFNLLQKLHQKELSAITRWWKDLDVPTNFPFARDRIVEAYFWALGVYFEPHFNVARKIFTKIAAMVSILDEIYDAYGRFEELEVFTATIQRWDLNTVDVLPEYMKFYYRVLLDVYDEIGKEIGKDETSYHIHYSIEAMKKAARFYFKEAEWLNKRYKPDFKEYMEMALDTTLYSELATISFVGMSDIITKDVFEWVCKCPKIIQASKIICRLMDDIVSHKFEQQREHIIPAINCYMEQYGCSEEEARVVFHKKIVDAWKDINEACLYPMDFSMPILMRVLNLSRVMDVLYKEEDGYTHSHGQTKVFIKSLLVDPVPY